jgi:hypothetical protein
MAIRLRVTQSADMLRVREAAAATSGEGECTSRAGFAAGKIPAACLDL